MLRNRLYSGMLCIIAVMASAAIVSGCAKARCERIAEAFDDCVRSEGARWDDDDFIEDCTEEQKDDSGCEEAAKDLDDCLGDNPNCFDFESCDYVEAVLECRIDPFGYIYTY